MFLPIIALFAAAAFCEIYLLVKVGSLIGAGETLWLVILTAVAGIWVAKSQGAKVIARMQADLQNAVLPADNMIHGLLIFIGGLLLVAPGFLTDFVGLTLVLPPTRLLWLKLAKRKLAKMASRGQVRYGGYGTGYTVYTYNSSSSSDDGLSRPMRDVTPAKDRLTSTQPK